MRNGFLYENLVLPFVKGKYYKVPFYHNKMDSDGLAISYSDEMKVKRNRFSGSKKQQFVEFKFNEDIDLDNNYYLEYSGSGVSHKKINIKFTEKEFYLNNVDIKKGINSFDLFKHKKFKNPILTLQSTKSKTKIDYKLIDDHSLSFKLDIDQKDDYKLLIKDGTKSLTIDLDWVGKTYNNADVLDFKLDIGYNKDSQKIKIILNNKYPLQEDKTLNFTGSLNKEVIWKKGKKTKEILFQKQILKFEKLNFSINNYVYCEYVINPEFFPTQISKTSKGIRFDKASNVNLVLTVDDTKHTIPARTLEYELIWSGEKEFKLSYDNHIITEKKISNDKFLPELSIKLQPLKAVISQPFYEDVIVEFKNVDKKYIIPAGSTEINLNFIDKGFRQITILKIENAKPVRKTWKIII